MEPNTTDSLCLADIYEATVAVATRRFGYTNEEWAKFITKHQRDVFVDLGGDGRSIEGVLVATHKLPEVVYVKYIIGDQKTMVRFLERFRPALSDVKYLEYKRRGTLKQISIDRIYKLLNYKANGRRT